MRKPPGGRTIARPASSGAGGMRRDTPHARARFGAALSYPGSGIAFPHAPRNSRPGRRPKRIMHGISYGLLVDTRHDTPVAGATPYPHAASRQASGAGLAACALRIIRRLTRVDLAGGLPG